MKRHKNTEWNATRIPNGNPKIAKQLLKSYARNISTLAKKSSILADITSSGDISLSMDTFDDYVATLEKLFVIQEAAWLILVQTALACLKD